MDKTRRRAKHVLFSELCVLGRGNNNVYNFCFRVSLQLIKASFRIPSDDAFARTQFFFRLDAPRVSVCGTNGPNKLH